MSGALPTIHLPPSSSEHQKSSSSGQIPSPINPDTENHLILNTQASLESLNPSSIKQSFKLSDIVRKRLNEEIKHRMSLIEKKKKDSLSLSIHLMNFISEKFDILYRHLNKHYEKLVTLLIKENLDQDEINIAKSILSANYVPDKDYRIRCEKIIDEAIISYKICLNATIADYGENKESVALKLGLLVEGHKDRINSIVLTSDQKYAVSGSQDATIRLWDLKSKSQENGFTGHSKSINSIATSADGKFLVSGSDDKTVRLWDIKKRTKIAVFTHADFVTSVAISDDSSFIVSGCNDTQVYVWDSSSKEKIAPLAGHKDSVLAVAIKKSKIIASGSKDNSIIIRNKSNPTLLSKLLGHTSQVNCLAFTSKNSILISGSNDNSLRVWDYKNENKNFVLKGHTHPVLSVLTTNNSKYAISSSIDRTIRIWNLINAIQENILIQKGAIRSICISKNDSFLVSVDNSLTMIVWDLITKNEMWKIANHTSNVVGVAVNSDKSAVVSKSANEFIVWNLKTMEQVAFINRVNANCIAVSQDASFLVLGLYNKGIYMWNIIEKNLYAETYDHNDIINCISISDDDSFVVTGSSDTQVLLTDLQDPTSFTIFTGHTDKVLSLAISSDKHLIVSGSADKTIIVWNIFLKKPQNIFKDHQEAVTSVAITSDTQFIISGSEDKSIRIWNLVENKIENVVNDIPSPINCLSLNYENNLIAIGLKDSSVIIINRDNITKWFKCAIVNNFKGCNKEIIGVLICQDSEKVVSCSKDGVIRKWDMNENKNLDWFSIQDVFNGGMVFGIFSSYAYIVSPYGGVDIFGVRENKILSFEKLYNKNLVHDVLMTYPAMKQFLKEKLGRRKRK